MQEELKFAHRYSSNNRSYLENDTRCGCFYCIAIFSPTEIIEWIDEEQTAMCPYCGTDSVIGQKTGYLLTELFLKEMNNIWF